MKRLLLILALLVMVVGVFISYVVGTHLVTYSIRQKAHELKEKSASDTDFANRVRVYAYETVIDPKIQTVPNSIRPAEMAVLTGTGDCSERALLIIEMLDMEGIKSYPIYGMNGRIGHMSVEYVTDGVTNRIDSEMYPQFVKRGDGLSPIEYIDNPYWFSGWGE